jgi:hypothetical protein
VVAPSAPAPAASAPAATPAPTSAPNALKSALAKLKGEVLVPAATPAPAAPAAPAALPTGINPPDARPPGVVDPAPAVAAPAPAAPEKRKPGRPKKVVEAASEAPTSSAPPEAPAAPAPTPTPAPATAPLPREWVEAELPASLSAPSGFTLMLDVAPVKGMAFQNIEDVLSAARTKVELEAGCSYRLIDYGKGPAFLAEQLEENFKIEPPCGAFFASSYGLDKEVLDVLVRHASVVFRATR